MYTETEGVIFRQIKTVNGRRMILLFSQKYGKISAGTSMGEKAGSRAALAMRPFTYGKYDLYKSRDSYSINGAEVIKAYYGIGEDVEKYMCASYVLEYTEKFLVEGAPDPKAFRLLLDFLEVIENRKKEYMTAVIAFQFKALQIAGMAPETGCCARCGAKAGLGFFSVAEGGVICGGCRDNIVGAQGNDELIYDIDFDIIVVLRYFLGNSLKSIEHLALDEKIMPKMRAIAKAYGAYHLGIKGLRSENILGD